MGRLLVAVDDAYAIAGLPIQSAIRSSEDVWELIRLTCEQLAAIRNPHEWADAIKADVERRFSGWMYRTMSQMLQLADTRHLHAHSRLDRGVQIYDGVVKPEKVLLPPYM